MDAVAELTEAPLFEGYDPDRFFAAVRDSLLVWRENDLYERKLEHSDFDGSVESWSDIQQLPTIGMEEFKQHPRELAIGELDETTALYSSGTTSGTKSYAARTEETLARHKQNLRRFSETIIGETDYAASLSVGPDGLEVLPTDLSRRALFRYIRWLMDVHESAYFMDVDETHEITPDFDGLSEYLSTHEGRGVLKGSASGISNFCDYLEVHEKHVDMGPDGIVISGGGWKGDDGKTRDDLRSQITERLGVTPENQLDFYSATEFTFFTGNKPGDEHPLQKRVPAQAYCYVADAEAFRTRGVVEPVETEGEPGLLVVVDPLNQSYPGIILTDDLMRKTGGEYGEDVRIEHVARSTNV